MPMPDISCDLRKLEFTEDNIADEIHAIHCLEHINRWETVSTLKEWHRVLKHGGLLVIEVPCLTKIVNILDHWPHPHEAAFFKLKDGRKVNQYDDAMDGLYGDRKTKAEGMRHEWCFTYVELVECMEAAGFSNVEQTAPVYHRPFRDMRVEVRK